MKPILPLAAVTLAALAMAAPAQLAASPAAPQERLDAVDHAEQLARLRLTGDLGMAPLPPVFADSPRHVLEFADRFPVNQEVWESQDGAPPTMFTGWIPAGPTGTGTTIGESFKYQLGNSYSAGGPPHPMVIAYHGYGASANSVGVQSTIDEECNARGWVYMAPTGLDDKLFGTPVSQQNVAAAIQWMLNNFNVDPDRLYMIGFSMGGGVVSNFASRHRDPDGLMIAGLALVSTSCDWAMTYSVTTSGVKTLMEHPFNFGGPPSTQPFRYQQASALHHAIGSYPPLPGALSTALSMATNLGSVPTYMVWDTGDPVVESSTLNPILRDALAALGGTLDWHTVSGTVDPITLLPAPHSWAVLDEADAFDFFDGLSVVRTPATFEAQLDLSADVSWASVVQTTTNAFTYVEGFAEAAGREVDVFDVHNARSVEIDGAAIGIAGGDPVAVAAAPAPLSAAFNLVLGGFDVPPAYLLDANSGQLVTGATSDPEVDHLIVEVPVIGGLDADLILDPLWTTDVTTSPNPVPIGTVMDLDIDAPAGGSTIWLLVGTDEQLATVKGGAVITVKAVPPAFLIPLPLDVDGDFSLSFLMPNEPSYQGLTLRLQGLVVDGANDVVSVSNMWVMEID